MELVCGFIEIERNSQLDPNRLAILHPWLKSVLLDCLGCLLIQLLTNTVNDTNVAWISIDLDNEAQYTFSEILALRAVSGESSATV